MLKMNKEYEEVFDKSDIGKRKNSYLKRAKVTGVLCVVAALIWIILNIYYKVDWKEYISPVLLILFGLYFVINCHFIKIKEVNKFMYEKKTRK